MEIFIISLVALIASLLTFFSGFGLGTILTPFLVLFFPVEVAITLTGIVHLLNNFFKITLVGKHINWRVGFKFGLTAMLGAFIGAWTLLKLSGELVVYTYQLYDKEFSITLIKLVISLLMIVFTLFDIVPALKKIQFSQNKLYIGGLISGFFGGLSGNQGALRSMFLIKLGLLKESYIATGIFIACCVDLTRLSVYFNRMSSVSITDNLVLLISAVAAAFAGAFIGNKLLKKVTFKFIQWIVTTMIIILAIGLGSGLI